MMNTKLLNSLIINLLCCLLIISCANSSTKLKMNKKESRSPNENTNNFFYNTKRILFMDRVLDKNKAHRIFKTKKKAKLLISGFCRIYNDIPEITELINEFYKGYLFSSFEKFETLIRNLKISQYDFESEEEEEDSDDIYNESEDGEEDNDSEDDYNGVEKYYFNSLFSNKKYFINNFKFTPIIFTPINTIILDCSIIRYFASSKVRNYMLESIYSYLNEKNYLNEKDFKEFKPIVLNKIIDLITISNMFNVYFPSESQFYFNNFIECLKKGNYIEEKNIIESLSFLERKMIIFKNDIDVINSNSYIFRINKEILEYSSPTWKQ